MSLLMSSSSACRKRSSGSSGITILAAILTPPDFGGSMLAMAIPLVLLFEISILLGKAIERSRARVAV